eukprot:6187436-Pleurochrysis_carterae.AAC.12
MELARRTVAVNFNTGGTLKEKQFQAKLPLGRPPDVYVCLLARKLPVPDTDTHASTFYGVANARLLPPLIRKRGFRTEGTEVYSLHMRHGDDWGNRMGPVPDGFGSFAQIYWSPHTAAQQTGASYSYTYPADLHLQFGFSIWYWLLITLYSTVNPGYSIRMCIHGEAQNASRFGGAARGRDNRADRRNDR